MADIDFITDVSEDATTGDLWVVGVKTQFGVAEPRIVRLPRAPGGGFLDAEVKPIACADGGVVVPTSIIALASSVPKLVRIEAGNGAVNPDTGLLDTFIFPVGEQVGVSEFTIDVSEPTTLTAHTVDWTGDGPDTPAITSYTHAVEQTHRIVLDRDLIPGHWAKFTLTVQSVDTGIESQLVVWIAHHPCNIDQNDVVNVRDATAFGVEFGGSRRKALIDLNRDDQVDVRDATIFGDNWNGRAPAATRPWGLHRLPSQP